MKAIEMFAGIGGFRLATESLNIETVWANDCCPKASKVYRDQFGPNSIQEEDIKTAQKSIPSHDLLTGGFPCQPFSSAGKKQGTKDSRGTLFSVIVDVLKTHQPKYFVLENVKRLLTMERGSHFATILASLAELDYCIEWRLLNAADFGLPQNRQRVFITGIRKSTRDHLARLASPSEIKQAKRKRDHSSFDWMDIASHGNRFPNWGLAQAGQFVGKTLPSFSDAQEAVTLRSVLQSKVHEQFDFTESTIARLKNSTIVERYVDRVEVLSNQGGGARMGYTVFGVNGLAPTLTSTASRHYERYKIGKQYRRLTNVEYARIQGFPDNHCDAVSIYHQYALYGNAVPPAMAAWVLKQVTSKGVSIQPLIRKSTQKKLFADV